MPIRVMSTEQHDRQILTVVVRIPRSSRADSQERQAHGGGQAATPCYENPMEMEMHNIIVETVAQTVSNGRAQVVHHSPSKCVKCTD